MGGPLPGRGHGAKRTMHSQRVKGGGIALPEDLARQKMQEEQEAANRHAMIIQVRTQTSIELMASLTAQALNANTTHGPTTAPLVAFRVNGEENELDIERTQQVMKRAALVATLGADALVEELFGVKITRAPLAEAVEEESEEGDADESSEEAPSEEGSMRLVVPD